MISANSIQRLYHPSKLGTLRAVKKLRALGRSESKSSIQNTEQQQLSREQVLEIYDWIAQLHAR